MCTRLPSVIKLYGLFKLVRGSWALLFFLYAAVFISATHSYYELRNRFTPLAAVCFPVEILHPIIDHASTCNGRVWFGSSYTDLLFKRNYVAGSIAIEDLFDSRLGRIAEEYSRLVNLNNYRLCQLQIKNFAYRVGRTAIAALLSNVASVSTNVSMFSNHTTIVLTKGTLSSNLDHPLANG